ncbi:MAG: sulfatase-like hydrolase/transferase [Bacteroidota bacterium]
MGVQVIITAIVLYTCIITSYAQEGKRPNIIVIMPADLGTGDLGFMGSKDIETPAIDALAENGMIFENGYATHNYSSPAAAGLLVGRHQARFGFESAPDHAPFDPYQGIPVEEKLFPERLKEVGYTTGMVGKWQLGSHANFHPLNRGFDYFYGFLGGTHNYFPEDVRVGTNFLTVPMEENRRVGEFKDYLTYELARHAVKFIKQNKNNPFMLYLPFNAPHGPLQAPQNLLDKYSHVEDNQRRTYLAMVDALDQAVGRVVSALKETNNFENTLIFFVSNHGGPYPEAWCQDLTYASNAPYRRGKVALTEGGIKIPFVAHWPAKIKAGTKLDGLVSALDVAATSIAVSGAAPHDALEGVNLMPYFEGKKKDSPHKALYWRMYEDDHLWAVRTEDYKYLHQPLPNVDLSFFDMKKDPYESNNLVGKYPEKQAELAKLWNDWNADNMTNYQLPYSQYKVIMKDFYKHLQDSVRKAAQEKKAYIVK